MWDFIAGIVVEIEDVSPISGPCVPLNRVACFVRHAMCVRAVERARPNVQRIAFVRRQSAQLRTIGRDFRIRPRRILEQNLPWDKRWQLSLCRTKRQKKRAEIKWFHKRRPLYQDATKCLFCLFSCGVALGEEFCGAHRPPLE